jgi:hypothetical protein
MPEAQAEVIIDLTGSGGTDAFATIERGPSAAGPWTMLTTVPLLAEEAVYIDATAPLDVPVYYRITGDEGGTQAIGPITVDSLGLVWIKDPLRPWATLAFSLCETADEDPDCPPNNPEYLWLGFGEEVWRGDAALFDRLNAETPADVYGRRKYMDGFFQVMTRSLAARDGMYTLFTAGGPVFLQLPAVYGWADAYVQPGDVQPTYIRPDQRVPDRRYAVPFTRVDAPVGPVQGALCATWCAVLDAFPTFADMTAAGGTWLDVADGSLVCP